MKGIFVLIFLISIIFAISLVGYQNLGDNSGSGRFKLTIITIGETINLEIDIENRNILEILEEEFEIMTSTAGAYKTLNCINDICTDGNFLWVFYVNQEVVLSSVDRLYPHDGDQILIKYGDVK